MPKTPTILAATALAVAALGATPLGHAAGKLDPADELRRLEAAPEERRHGAQGEGRNADGRRLRRRAAAGRPARTEGRRGCARRAGPEGGHRARPAPPVHAGRQRLRGRDGRHWLTSPGCGWHRDVPTARRARRSSAGRLQHGRRHGLSHQGAKADGLGVARRRELPGGTDDNARRPGRSVPPSPESLSRAGSGRARASPPPPGCRPRACRRAPRRGRRGRAVPRPRGRRRRRRRRRSRRAGGRRRRRR